MNVSYIPSPRYIHSAYFCGFRFPITTSLIPIIFKILNETNHKTKQVDFTSFKFSPPCDVSYFSVAPLKFQRQKSTGRGTSRIWRIGVCTRGDRFNKVLGACRAGTRSVQRGERPYIQYKLASTGEWVSEVRTQALSNCHGSTVASFPWTEQKVAIPPPATHPLSAAGSSVRHSGHMHTPTWSFGYAFVPDSKRTDRFVSITFAIVTPAHRKRPEFRNNLDSPESSAAAAMGQKLLSCNGRDEDHRMLPHRCRWKKCHAGPLRRVSGTRKRTSKFDQSWGKNSARNTILNRPVS